MRKRIHFNRPQLRSIMFGAPMEILVAGRGMGKTTGVLAAKSANCYLNTMPRSTGLILNATFTQAYSRTLKELIRGWQNLGYKEGHHFVIGRRPNDKWIKQWKWEGPFAPPIDYKHFICWWNGAVYQLISQERPGSTNGVSIDHMIGDELKLLNYEKLATETFPANRGIIPQFANNPYHHGFTFTTDMPVGTSSRWILDYAEKMDKQKIDDFSQLLQLKFWLETQKKESKGNRVKVIQSQIDTLCEEMQEMRRGMLLYHEASTLENLDALGIDYIEQQLLNTTLFQFDTQMLNLRPLRLEDGFYPDFDEEYHGYFAENPDYFDRSEIDYLDPDLDCRKDADLNMDMALHISLDYNKRIHPLSTVQKYKEEIRAINGLHVEYPLKLKDIIKKFVTYYKAHRKKVVYYWYDHTATSEQHETSPKEDVVNGLRKAGWTVIEMYIGNSGILATHDARYRMWGSLLTEDGTYKERFRINRETCNKLIASINQAGTIPNGKGFAKNKKPEKDPKFPATDATHYSESLDIIVWGLLHSGLQYTTHEPSLSGSMMMG